MNKKGISPLIATLLLISFAVALGVVIMNFGQAQVELEAECTINIGLRFAEIEGKTQMCYDRSKEEIFFVVENGVNIKVEGLVINVIGTKQVQTFDFDDAKMDKAGAYLKNVPFSLAEGGEIRQIKVVPKVIMYDEEVICQEKFISVDELRDC